MSDEGEVTLPHVVVQDATPKRVTPVLGEGALGLMVSEESQPTR
jgi:hypothetical protein